MEEQPDYLINDPRFSDLTDPQHQELAKLYFQSLKQKAERLEIAFVRQDWEIPEGPSDGMARVAAGNVTSDFDVAVRELARAKGKREPDLPREDSSGPSPTFFEEVAATEVAATDHEGVVYETAYPSSTVRGKSYRVALTSDGLWSCECEGFRHLARCKHLAEVRDWYEQQRTETQAPEHPPQAPSAPPVAVDPSLQQDPRVPLERPINTPVPQGGVMIGGPPSQEGSARAPLTPPSPAQPVDPWSPRQDVVVEPGATVTLRPRKRS